MAIEAVGPGFDVGYGSWFGRPGVELARLSNGNILLTGDFTYAIDNPDAIDHPFPGATEWQGQIFDPAGNEVSDVFAIAGGVGDDASVAPLAGGGFVAVYGGGVAKLFSNDGAQIGGAFLVSTDVASDLNATSVGNGFLVVWTDDDPSADGSGSALGAQLFDAAGNKIGPEFRANGVTRGDQTEPVAVALGNGGYALFWSSDDQAGLNLPASAASEIKGQIFDSGGTRIGGEFIVNSATAGDQFLPDAAVLANGTIAVVWTTADPAADGSDHAIKGQLIGSDGTPIGGEFLINSVAAGNQVQPTVAAVGNGFVVAWRSDQAAGGPVIKAQQYDANGVKVGGEVFITEPGENSFIIYAVRSSPEIEDLGGGKFAVAWEGAYNNAYGIFTGTVEGRIFQATPGVTPPPGPTAGSDTLFGTSGDDSIAGLAGDDEIHGGGGQDRLAGNAGDDLLYGEAGDDYLNGHQGNDRLFGQQGADQLFGEDGQDRLYGGDGADSLYGQGGDDLLYGEGDRDRLDGGAGADTLFGQGDDDQLYGGGEHDALYGGDGKDALSGGEGNDDLFGEGGDDKLFGEGGHDRLDGGLGKDQLSGGDGGDFLNGGDGEDLLSGGAGSDMFFFADPAFAGVDRIADFASGVDRIGISGAGFGLAPGALPAASFAVGAAAAGAGAGFFYNPANHILYWDGDGNGANPATAVALFLNGAQPTAADFIIL